MNRASDKTQGSPLHSPLGGLGAVLLPLHSPLGGLGAVLLPLLLLPFIVGCHERPLGEHMSLTTLSYAVKGADTLRMDVYLDSAAMTESARRPVMIFTFGGGWESGRRQDGRQFLVDAAHHGYVAVGIDYRLGIKAIKEQGVEIDSANFASSYSQAILMGVEDLFDATRYLADHAEEWQADTGRIVVCGSSAGATNSLTAEYLICNADSLAQSRLPRGFNYAAVIPLAGGIWLAQTDTLVWQQRPCPILAFHGTSDPLVPYDHVVLPGGAFGGFGPGYYVPQLKRMNVPHYLHAYDGAGHIIAAVGNNAKARNEMFHFLDSLTTGPQSSLLASPRGEEDSPQAP